MKLATAGKEAVLYTSLIYNITSHICVSSPVSGSGNLILSKLRENCGNSDTFRNSFLGVFLQQKESNDWKKI